VLGANPAGDINLGVNFPGGGKPVPPSTPAPIQRPGADRGAPAEAPAGKASASQVEHPQPAGAHTTLKPTFRRRSLLQLGLFDSTFSLDQLLQAFYPYPVLTGVNYLLASSPLPSAALLDGGWLQGPFSKAESRHAKEEKYLANC